MFKKPLVQILHCVSFTVVTFFPLLVLVMVRFGGSDWLMMLGAVCFLLQCFFAIKRKSFLNLTCFFGLLLGVASVLLNEKDIFFWYPVLVNLALLIVFSLSLIKGVPIVEQLARLTNPDFPNSAIPYTRRLTFVWCIFFVLNGSIATWTVLENNIFYWSLWNGCLSYICVGSLFLGEVAYRKLFLHV